MLFIHGGLGHADLWAAQIKSLSNGFRVIVADTRGHGRSTHDGQPFSYELLADDYLALLDHLQIDKVHLIGGASHFAPLQVPERFTYLFRLTLAGKANGD